MKNRSLHIIAFGAFTILFVLGLACATTPTVQVNLSESYRLMVSQPTGNERPIDIVTFNGNSKVCREQHSVTPYALGASYYEREDRASGKHRDESIIDQLLSEANRLYPSENISIRNARVAGNQHINTRYETLIENYRDSYGQMQSRQIQRPVWDCYLVYIANVITNEPMPQPVTHSENFTMPGLSRNDIYRSARNWLDDNTQRRGITVQSENFDRGRITGTVRCYARTDRTYIVTSSYIIDVYDARVEMRFADTILQRVNTSGQFAGNPEQIFLQSIADAAKEELVDFATSLRSFILSR